MSDPALGPGPPEDDNWVPFTGIRAWMGREATTPPTSPAAPDAGDPQPYVDLVKDLLTAEQTRVERMEARGLAVVTTSGALATLLLGIAALVTRDKDVHIEKLALVLAALAALAFVGAALLAIAANRPTRAWNVDPQRIVEELRERWGRTAPPDQPAQKATVTRVEMWKSLHKLSQTKAELVFSAILVESIAVALLATSVTVILI